MRAPLRVGLDVRLWWVLAEVTHLGSDFEPFWFDPNPFELVFD
jgi:hypothetical protein